MIKKPCKNYLHESWLRSKPGLNQKLIGSLVLFKCVCVSVFFCSFIAYAQITVCPRLYTQSWLVYNLALTNQVLLQSVERVFLHLSLCPSFIAGARCCLCGWHRLVAVVAIGNVCSMIPVRPPRSPAPSQTPETPALM